MHSITKRKSLRFAIILVITLSLVGSGVVFYALNSQVREPSPRPGSDTTATQNGTSTPKDDLEQTSSSPPNNNVSVIVVDASQYDNIFEVRAYANIIESGTCSYVFSSGSFVIRKTTEATAGPSTSPCATLDVPLGELSANKQWSLTVSYKSASGIYQGSTDRSITIK